jgi:hypothetical protein
VEKGSQNAFAECISVCGDDENDARDGGELNECRCLLYKILRRNINLEYIMYFTPSEAFRNPLHTPRLCKRASSYNSIAHRQRVPAKSRIGKQLSLIFDSL